MTLLTFEGKKFYADGTIREEGEFKEGKLNGLGQKRDIIYGLLFTFIFSLYRMTSLTFEGKKFNYKGRVEEEGEFKEGKLNELGQKRNITYGLLFRSSFLFIE